VQMRRVLIVSPVFAYSARLERASHAASPNENGARGRRLEFTWRAASRWRSARARVRIDPAVEAMG